ncbi:outer membrane protein assembly factor BamB family protein [Desertihabitans aurantiacus]|uniref:outer membrane protein assembly factor BamB family protein n=1 Tax=Desertihabitans aurantiacus TaxID=2282477 RepID=UPI0018E53A8B|nr:PQQ-binding-like beta-propeller repeat protein [Desertihabitans aurantiacus]
MRTRNRPLASALLGVAGVALGVATVVLGLGWPLWVLALLAVGVAVVLVLSGSRRSALVGLVAAAAVVGAGVVAVAVPPPLPPGAVALPPATPEAEDEDDVTEVGRDDRVRVLIDHQRTELVGYSLDGEQVWVNEEAYPAGSRTAVLAGDSVVTVTTGGQREPAIAVSTATGETQWSAEVGGARPFAADEEVVVFADDGRTLALDRRSGEQRWEVAEEAVASNQGASSFYPRRWSGQADWLVVGGLDRLRFRVLDLRTAEVATEFDVEHFQVGDWAIAGDTLITFDHVRDQRVAVGRFLTGGGGWTTEIGRDGAAPSYEPVGDRLRITTATSVRWLEAGTGELTTVELARGWHLASKHPGVPGARMLLAEERDEEYHLLSVGVLDSRTGVLTELDDAYREDAAVVGATPTGTLLALPYRDAVGGEHERTVLVPNPS